jgi:hypothetical protein
MAHLWISLACLLPYGRGSVSCDCGTGSFFFPSRAGMSSDENAIGRRGTPINADRKYGFSFAFIGVYQRPDPISRLAGYNGRDS